MVKLLDKLTEWRKKKNNSKKRKIEQNDSIQYNQDTSKSGNRVTFSSPSDPKRPGGKLTISSFDDSDPKNPNFLDMVTSLSNNSFCIGYVGIIDSPKKILHLSMEEAASYYEIFFKSMHKIIEEHYGRIIKNHGDGFLYYFPKSYNGSKKGLKDCIDCGIEMSVAHGNIRQQLVTKKLPPFDYRISSDFGPVLIIKTSVPSGVDLIGTTVNLCAKINPFAPRNEFAIGSDMHQLVKGFKEYQFKELNGFSLGRNGNYPVFTPRRKTGFFG